MPYSDSNPERRNLTVLSLAIIVYYMADGQFLDGEVNLMLINAKFNNPFMLVIFVWVMLCWFLFRYIITNRGSAGEYVRVNAVTVDIDYSLVRRYVEKNYNASNYDLSKARIYAQSATGWEINISGCHGKLTGIGGNIIKLLFLLKIIFKSRATTDYYTPYLLFFCAVGLGICNK